jgi:hypothetical protein
MSQSTRYKAAAVAVGATIAPAAYASTDAGVGYALAGAVVVVLFILGFFFAIPASGRTRPLRSMTAVALFPSTILFFVLGIHMETITLGLLTSAAAFVATAAGYGLGYLTLGIIGKVFPRKAR